MAPARPPPRPSAVILVVIGVLLVRALLQVWLYDAGFLSVSADEWTRARTAWAWAHDPRWLGLLDRAWLPLETYLNGVAMAVSGELVVAPRVTAFASSCGATIALLFLTRALFRRWATALFAVALLSVFPWFWWLSGTPMLEMYLLAPLLGALALIADSDEPRRARDLAAGALLALASAFHLQAWLLVEVVVAATVTVRVVGASPEGRARRALASLPLVLVANGAIALHLVGAAASDAGLTDVLASHAEYSRWRYQGYDVDVLERLLYYPRLLVDEAGVPFVALTGVGALLLARPSRAGGERAAAARWLPLLVAAGALLLLSAFNLTSVPATAAPGRFSLAVFALLVPYASHGALASSRWLVAKLQPRRAPAVVVVLGAVWLTLLIVPYVARAADFPTWRPGTVDVGRELARRLSDDAGNAVVEVVYWDFLVIEGLSGAPERVVRDRESDRRDRSARSLLERSSQELANALAMEQVRYLVLRAAHLRAAAWRLGAREIWSGGEWTLFELPAREARSR